MKTIYAPDTALACKVALQTYAQDNIGVVFIAAIVLTALLATWASKRF